MKIVSLTILAVVGVLTVSPLYAGTCDEIAAQDLNSRIEADISLAETSDGLEAAGQERIRVLREDFSKVSDLQTQALDSGDLTKLKEVCPMYEDILRQIESLNN
jgi:hypothetical protein